MKNFIVAKSAGFCFGVSRSVEMAQKLLESGSAYSLGQLIHNDDVVRRFEGRGLKVINSPDELPAGAEGHDTLARCVEGSVRSAREARRRHNGRNVSEGKAHT